VNEIARGRGARFKLPSIGGGGVGNLQKLWRVKREKKT